MKIPVSILTDILMIVLFVLLMADVHTGNPVHEWMGILLSVSIMLHAWLNRAWYHSLRKGSYSVARTFRLVLNMLLLFFMAGTLASAVLISRTVFAFAEFEGALLARTVHVFCAHWCFLLAAVHLGMYGRRFCVALSQHISLKLSGWHGLIPSSLGIAAAVYGVYAFYSRELIYSLTLRSAFMPWSESAVRFLLDYCAIFFLCAWTCSMLSSLAHARKTHEPLFSNQTRQRKAVFSTDTCNIRSNV